MGLEAVSPLSEGSSKCKDSVCVARGHIISDAAVHPPHPVSGSCSRTHGSLTAARTALADGRPAADGQPPAPQQSGAALRSSPGYRGPVKRAA